MRRNLKDEREKAVDAAGRNYVKTYAIILLDILMIVLLFGSLTAGIIGNVSLGILAALAILGVYYVVVLLRLGIPALQDATLNYAIALRNK